ncbi:hypothetical protein ACFQBY_02510 [Promicromonospora citrea]|uniref:DUF4352 domain-containing protein n=1 Tax=Promicromonospora citrea TaxID=43677 RepID=A0A8H9GHC3_9MICO|nr:hypothetical protein [Promicromonospora citrea]NNH52426.1 hypothetical protein [Promicromonospora citrea]GGM22136.1 hypothetical protein GCM10010102_17270 [Promicromonospora citrea]
MKRLKHGQRNRRVALAVASLVLVGALGACSRSTGDDAKSAASETSASAGASEPAEVDSEAPAEDVPAAESKETAETDSDKPLNFAKDPSLAALFGQSVDTYGIIVTVDEPEPKNLFPEWEGTVDPDLKGITVEVTVENTLNTEAATGSMGYTAFSGESEGEYLSNSEGDQESPAFVPAGRSATWIETFAVEDPDDVYLSVTTPTESTVPFVTQTQMDLIEGEVSTD